MRYLVFLLVTVQFSTSVLAEQQTLPGNQSDGGPHANLEQIVQATRAVVDLSDPTWHHRRYHTLFNNVNPDELGPLQTHREDSIAVRAAWQTVVFSAPDNGSEGEQRPDRRRLDWFLGFLQGRLRIQTPSWWSDALLDCRARSGYVRPGDFRKPTCHKAGAGELRAPADTALKQDGDTVTLTVGNESAPLPKELLAKTDTIPHRPTITVLMTPSRYYIAVYSQVGFFHDLACVDRSSGKTLWRSTVRGAWSGAFSGCHKANVTITEQGERVVVFGCALTGIYVEVFQSADGSVVSRFASSY